MEIEIREKQFKSKFEYYFGSNICNDISIYNKIFETSKCDKNDIKFFVMSDEEKLVELKKYEIYGCNILKVFYPFPKYKYFYEVEIFDDEPYCKESSDMSVFGKIKSWKRYNTNFNYEYDYKRNKGNTFLDFIETLRKEDFPDDPYFLECFSASAQNADLLKNIMRYKGLKAEDYDESCIEDLKLCFLENVKITNKSKDVLEGKIKKVNTMAEFLSFLKTNKNLCSPDNNMQLYEMNDDIHVNIPVNILGRNLEFSFINKKRFNSALPFYFQYRNYRNSTIALMNIFVKNIVEKEPIRQENALKQMGIKVDENGFHKISDIREMFNLKDVGVDEYGLYYPLLMNFRQSVELSFKLIFINEIVKKENLTLEEINEHKKNKIDEALIFENGLRGGKELKSVGLATHNLLSLLSFIKDYIKNKKHLSFLQDLASFIYFLEHKNPSFSRYILDVDLNVPIEQDTAYYDDLISYIVEFYEVMDDILKDLDFGFNIENVFCN